MRKGYKLLVKVIIGLFTALALVGCVSEKDADKGVDYTEIPDEVVEISNTETIEPCY